MASEDVLAGELVRELMQGDNGTCAVQDCGLEGKWYASAVPVVECDGPETVQDIVLCDWHAAEVASSIGDGGLPKTVRLGPRWVILIEEEH